MPDGKPEPSSPRRSTSRRDFLRAAGLTAAGAGVGGALGFAGYLASVNAGGPSPIAAPIPLDPITHLAFEHIVVLMAENRSFDNLLGWLYTPDDLPEGETFEGLAFGDYANKAPDGTRIPAHVYTGETDGIMQSPDPDPGEEYPHVNTQLFNRIDPRGNRAGDIGTMAAPFNAPAAGATPKMDGFLTDYEVNVRYLRGRKPTLEELRPVMGGFSPQMLPVLSTLAREFAVFDHWHAAVPSQTFCNRSFFHAGTSHGFVTNVYNGGFQKWLNAPPTPTIFDRLEAAGKSWRIYFDELQLVSYTGFVHAPTLEKFWKTDHFATMSRFYDDVSHGALPAYAFIEPRLVYDHNDFHPPFGALRMSEVDGQDIFDSAQSDVRAGELLVHQVYSAIRGSTAPGGSSALNTLLLITFDEHGGTYDHVPPPAATPPDTAGPGEMGFEFDRLGCRVPTIAISAYTGAGTILHDLMDHGSMLATLEQVHGLDPLTARDAAANPIFGVVNLGTPRDPSTWPVTTPQYNPPNSETAPPHPANINRRKPLTPPAQGILGLLIAKYDPDRKLPENYEEAYDTLRELGNGVFGVGASEP